MLTCPEKTPPVHAIWWSLIYLFASLPKTELQLLLLPREIIEVYIATTQHYSNIPQVRKCSESLWQNGCHTYSCWWLNKKLHSFPQYSHCSYDFFFCDRYDISYFVFNDWPCYMAYTCPQSICYSTRRACKDTEGLSSLFSSVNL